jgi:hypothetical protein
VLSDDNNLYIVKTETGFTAFMEQFISDINGKLTNTKTGYQLLYKPDKGLVQISNVFKGKPLSTVDYSKIRKNFFCATNKNRSNINFKSETIYDLNIFYYFQCPNGLFFDESICVCNSQDAVVSFPSLEQWGYTDDCSKQSFMMNLSCDQFRACPCLSELINNGVELSYSDDNATVGVKFGSYFIIASTDMFPELKRNTSAPLWYVLDASGGASVTPVEFVGSSGEGVTSSTLQTVQNDLNSMLREGDSYEFSNSIPSNAQSFNSVSEFMNSIDPGLSSYDEILNNTAGVGDTIIQTRFFRHLQICGEDVYITLTKGPIYTFKSVSSSSFGALSTIWGWEEKVSGSTVNNNVITVTVIGYRTLDVFIQGIGTVYKQKVTFTIKIDRNRGCITETTIS